MATQSTPSPERATQSAGRKIPIDGVDDPKATQAQDGTSGVAQQAAEQPAAQSEAAADDGQNVESDKAQSEEAQPEQEQPSSSEEVAKARAEAKDWQDKFLRLHAEWDTYRRRTAEQREEERVRAAEKLVESLLPVVDDFERTIAYADQNGETGLIDGVKAVHTKLVGVLTKDGVEVIDPVGEAFDALEAQAVSTFEDASVPDETVHEVFQKGYRMGSKVIRPAMVTVTTGGPKREKPKDDEE